MKKPTLILSSILILSLILSGCNKDIVTCSLDTEFCSLIVKEDFENNKLVINKFLSKQKGNLTEEEKIDQLVDWLNCKSCVSNVEIVTFIRTFPVKCLLKVNFKVLGKEEEKRLIVGMSNPFKSGPFID